MDTQRRPRPPLYTRWRGMRQRCSDPNAGSYGRYGGRGIRVCERWDDFATFAQDVGIPPTPAHQLDRIDPDGDYEPGNVRWATRSQQMRNTTRTTLTETDVARIRAGYTGRRGECASLAREFNTSRQIVHNIVNGLTWVEEAST